MNGLNIPVWRCLVETIQSRAETALNTKINKWLQDNSDCTIVDMKLAANNSGYICLVVYQKPTRTGR